MPAKTPIESENTREKRIAKATTMGLSQETATLFEDQGVLAQWLINKRKELKEGGAAKNFAEQNEDAIAAALELQRKLEAYNTAHGKTLKLNLKAKEAKDAVINSRVVTEEAKQKRAATRAKNKAAK